MVLRNIDQFKLKQTQGFYLVQTNQGYNNFEKIQNLNNLKLISYVFEPGDCLLIYNNI